MLTNEDIIKKLNISALDPEYQEALVRTYRKSNIKSIQRVRKKVRTDVVINIIRMSDYSKLEMEELAVKCCNISSRRFRKIFKKERLKKERAQAFSNKPVEGL